MSTFSKRVSLVVVRFEEGRKKVGILTISAHFETSGHFQKKARAVTGESDPFRVGKL